MEGCFYPLQDILDGYLFTGHVEDGYLTQQQHGLYYTPFFGCILKQIRVHECFGHVCGPSRSQRRGCFKNNYIASEYISS